MTIKSMELTNYRNYEKQSISFCDGINIIFGQNAQGKTNILEALYISSTGKSHRTSNYQELIRTGNQSFEVKLKADIDNRENTIIIRYSREKGRYAEINGIKRDKLSDILGTLNMILFSPETLDVVKGPPAVRRRFLDILLCQSNRQYLHCLQQYNKLVKNKSLALKKGKHDQKYESVLPIWNEHIARYGGTIAFLRLQAIKKLDFFMKKEMRQITSGKEESELIYKSFCLIDENKDESYYQHELLNKLNEGLEKEISVSQCLYGAHRDDFEILLNGMNSRQYCSQGQQRTLALSLIMSELFFIEEAKGEKPVLLLDDVMSELDLARQEYLIQGLHNVQTIITTTDELPFSSIRERNIRRFYVEKGSVMVKVDQ